MISFPIVRAPGASSKAPVFTGGVNVSGGLTVDGGATFTNGSVVVNSLTVFGANVNAAAAVLTIQSVGQTGVALNNGTTTISGGAAVARFTADATGLGFYGHATVAQPAAPVLLADVIAIIRGCGLSA